MKKTVKDIFQELRQELPTEADLEAKIILEHILNISPAEMISSEDLPLTKNQIKKISDIKDKRIKERIPLAYLLEEAYFQKLKLFVNSDVLIPRPETELLIDITLEEIKTRKIHHPTILDLGTGSGCIAIALKLALPAAKVYASDISRAALNVAAINAKRYNAEIEFVMGDFFDPFLGLTQSPIAVPVMHGNPPYFDIIVSNPPYISETDYQKLEAELHHEPKHALVGFPYKQLRQQMPSLIHPGGFFAAEFGMGQSQELKEIFPDCQIYKDLAGIDRMLVWGPKN